MGVRTRPSHGPVAGEPEEGEGGLAVEAAGINKRFVKGEEENHVLQDVSIRVDRGEFASLIGPSGCGKSTFLKILAGLEPCDTGSIRILGADPGSGRFDVGFVFQHLALLPWRNVLQNVLLPSEFLDVSRADAQRQARSCLEMVGLDGYENYRLREISGGMQQRVALARVLMTDAKLLLLDEPFGALDELTREVVDVTFMEVCAKTRAAAILVTHSVQEAVFMSDRVFVMSPKPARILEEIPVPIPHPRPPEVMGSEAFAKTVERVRIALGLEH